MSHLRLFMLTFGPVGLVAGSYWVAMPDAVRGVVATDSRGTAVIAPVSTAPAQTAGTSLSAACHDAARDLTRRLGSDRRVVVRPPYVLAGDLDEAALAAWHDRLIAPVAACLRRELFARDPDRPIAVVLCSSERAYHESVLRLDGRSLPQWYGYYERNERRLVVNVSTGDGTLVHELVHALVHVDCPHVPEWFDEGLASLYEYCRFSVDGRRLEGLSNWRLATLRQAMNRNELQPLTRLAAPGGMHRGAEAVDYAHARYLCLYLQEQGLLAAYYRRLRASVAQDPDGLRTLCDLLGVPAPDAVDERFRRWVQQRF